MNILTSERVATNAPGDQIKLFTLTEWMVGCLGFMAYQIL